VPGNPRFDVALNYWTALIGGDDIGSWQVTWYVPAEERPLANYIDPNSHIWRCPADDHPLVWYYGDPAWDSGTSSYMYNPNTSGLYGPPPGEMPEASLTIMLGDWVWQSTAPVLEPNDLFMFTYDVTTWWHPLGFENRKCPIVFVDGHARYIPIQINVPNTDHYRRNPLGLKSEADRMPP